MREQVAGVFQANILSAVLRDLNKEQPKYNAALKVSINATNEADQATAQLNKTLSALVTQINFQVTNLFSRADFVWRSHPTCLDPVLKTTFIIWKIIYMTSDLWKGSCD